MLSFLRFLAKRIHVPLPRRTVRMRLTLLYSLLFLLSGAALLTITYLLVNQATDTLVLSQGTAAAAAIAGGSASPSHQLTVPGSSLPPQFVAEVRELYAKAVQQHADDVHQLLVQSGIALGIMTMLSIVLGWLAAGRALRPLRHMTAMTQRISERNLHERLAVDGPPDEVTGLAGTIDGLLGRLETAFDSQRHFVANASHELRTPLTLERTLLEVALANPDATADSLRDACQRVVATTEKHEHLIESLLTLAIGQRGLDGRVPVDLSVAADQVLLEMDPEIDREIQRQQLRIETAIASAPAVGDPRLIERLVANLFDNAVRYNRGQGRVRVATGTKDGVAFVSVSNTGPPIAPGDVDGLFEPFQRLSPQRARSGGGTGLGLSIVKAIAAAHEATIAASSVAGGGLDIEVSFPIPVVPTGSRRNDRHPVAVDGPVQHATVSMLDRR
jgi:signal transduction histidine kinase